MSRNKQYSDKELLKDLKEVNDEFDHPVKKREYEEHGKSSTTTIRNRFGSFNDAKRKAGLDFNERGEMNESVVRKNREEIIDYINEGLRYKEIAKILGVSYSNFCRGLRKAGIRKLNKFTEASKDTNYIASFKKKDLEKAGFDPSEEVYWKKKVEDGRIIMILEEDRVFVEENN